MDAAHLGDVSGGEAGRREKNNKALFLPLSNPLCRPAGKAGPAAKPKGCWENAAAAKRERWQRRRWCRTQLQIQTLWPDSFTPPPPARARLHAKGARPNRSQLPWRQRGRARGAGRQAEPRRMTHSWRQMCHICSHDGDPAGVDLGVVVPLLEGDQGQTERRNLSFQSKRRQRSSSRQKGRFNLRINEVTSRKQLIWICY